MGWFTGKKRRKAEEEGLNHVLLDLGKGVPFDVRMATEGVFVCAELGWGNARGTWRYVATPTPQVVTEDIHGGHDHERDDFLHRGRGREPEERTIEIEE